MKILVVEDDGVLALMLSKVLKANHYQVELAADGETGLAMVEAFDYDLILLDLCLPKLDGIRFCQRVRDTGKDVPVLLTTAEDTTASKIAGLDAGADDYVLRPLDIDDLLARIRALLRRGRTDTSPVLCWGAVSLDPSNCEVFCYGKRLHLTNKEYEILELFLRNPHRIFGLDVLLEQLWSYEKMPSDNAVRTHIKSLRRKLEQSGIANMVETVYGSGYRLGLEPYCEPSAAVDAELAIQVSPTNQEDLKAVDQRNSDQQKAGGEALYQNVPMLSRLHEIWKEHQQKYLDMITLLEQIVPVLAVPQDERMMMLSVHKDQVVRSQQAAHTLKGALGSFGFMHSSKIAAGIEKLLLAAPQLDIEQINQLPNLIASLRQSLEPGPEKIDTSSSASLSQPNSLRVAKPLDLTEPNATGSNSTNKRWVDLPKAVENSVERTALNGKPIAKRSSHSASLSPPLLKRFGQQPNPSVYEWLIVDSDQALIESLTRQASIWSIQTWFAATLEAARVVLEQHSPAVIMVDPSCANTREEGLSFLRELAKQWPAMSVIVATDSADWSSSPEERLRHRVEVLRASHESLFLQKPVATEQIIETVNQCLTEQSLAEAKVLVLDDDPQILQCLKQLLDPWGFQLTLLSDPFQLWDVLEQTVPDLLILDIEMPEFNGLELCRVIRHDPNLSQLPILFLSAHTEPDIVQRVFESGADDYVSKPIIGSELVSRILNRLERLHLLRRLAETDSLTGLSRRRQSVELFDRLIRLANRKQTTLCLALLDLDCFKQVNDRYGHEMGDHVLKTFGDMLRQAFRDEDMVARWGGEEFVVGLYDTSKAMAMQRLSAFLEQFSQHSFEQDKDDAKQMFQVSFSGGIAAYPADGEDIQQLYRQADEALYRAKAAGRSRLLATETN